MLHIKTIKVTNPKNVLAQIPGFVAKKWCLKVGDNLDVYISEDEGSIIIKPRRSVQARSRTATEGGGVS